MDIGFDRIDMFDPSYLDVFDYFRLHHAIDVEPADCQHLLLQRRSGDVTLGELHNALCIVAFRCRKCRYNLRGHIEAKRGNCPECGSGFDFNLQNPAAIWLAMTEAIASILNTPVSLMKTDTFFYRDIVVAEEQLRREAEEDFFGRLRKLWQSLRKR